VVRPRKVDRRARRRCDALRLSAKLLGALTDLPSSFTVHDGSAAQTITHFGIEQRPLVAAILLDTSFSMRGDPIEAARQAATRFVKSLAPGDRAMVVTFSDEPHILIEPTTDKERLAKAIATIDSKGGTALYDAIYEASERLSREEGRKVIVLLSDGRDEAQSGVEPGSLHTFDEALEKTLRCEAILFSIGFGRQVEKEMRSTAARLKQILDRLATDSGGVPTPRAPPAQGRYDLIGEELRNQYSPAYSPLARRRRNPAPPIRSSVGPSLKVYTRRRYAPKTEAADRSPAPGRGGQSAVIAVAADLFRIRWRFLR
jgi:VWFA-related protein